MMPELEITERHLAEWIQLVFVSLLAIAAWLRPRSRSRQLMVSKLAFIAIGAIVLARLSAQLLTPAASAVLRDWVPAALLVPYWQIGQFFTATGTIELPLRFPRGALVRQRVRLQAVIALRSE
jgi:hypothetical protein